jgi:heme exporter protein D
MGDGYFYTLSAIAQSFAAIIALSAVFVIYKLQVLKNQQTELIKKLRNIKLRDMTKYHSFSREVAVDELDRMTDI